MPTVIAARRRSARSYCTRASCARRAPSIWRAHEFPSGGEKRRREMANERERDPNRDKAIELAIGTIEKQYGKGSIMRLGADQAPPEIKVISTGALGLDIALGIGGLPRGRIVEVYGPESSG